MTREEAIEILRTADFPEDYTAEEVQQALDMAIRALKNEQTDGDLISREIEKADFLMAKVKDFERTAIRVKHNTEIIDRLIDYIHGVIVNAEKDRFVIDEERKCALREKFKLPSAEKTDGDLISRQAVLDIISDVMPIYSDDYHYILNQRVKDLPSAEKTAEEPIKHFGAIECPNCGRLLMIEEQTYDWCKGCKEYDTEKHCCHRYSSFIRESLQENINAVLEDIKAEIKELTNQSMFDYVSNSDLLDVVVEIIDKHISGKEE